MIFFQEYPKSIPRIKQKNFFCDFPTASSCILIEDYLRMLFVNFLRFCSLNHLIIAFSTRLSYKSNEVFPETLLKHFVDDTENLSFRILTGVLNPLINPTPPLSKVYFEHLFYFFLSWEINFFILLADIRD